VLDWDVVAVERMEVELELEEVEVVPD